MAMEPSPKQHFVFYDYLLFIWKKKIVLFSISIIILIGTLIFSILQKTTYQGEATFYVTDHLGEITTPESVITKYRKHLPKELQPSFEAVVVQYGQMTLRLSGTNKKQVESHFKKISQSYFTELKTRSTQKYNMMVDYQKKLEKNITNLKQILSVYNGKIGSLKGKDLENALHTQDELALQEEKLQVSKLNLQNFTKPELLQPTSIDQIEITKKGNPLVGNLVIAGLSSLLLTILVLVFWKYISDARMFGGRKN